MIEEYDGKRPRFGENVFIASTAAIIGDVEIARGSSVWYGAVIRGDRSLIRIGRNTNIQDNCTIHSDPTYPVSIGDNVSIGIMRPYTDARWRITVSLVSVPSS